MTYLANYSVLVVLASWLLLGLFSSTKADFQCYSCVYIDKMSDDNIPSEIKSVFHKSCANGKKPKQKFLSTCNDKDDGCGKIHYSTFGYDSYYGFVDFQVTIRSCMPKIPKFGGQCNETTLANLRKDGEIPQAIKEGFNDSLDGNTDITICSCNSNECNGVARLVNISYIVMVGIVTLLLNSDHVCL